MTTHSLAVVSKENLPDLSKAKLRRGQFYELFSAEFIEWGTVQPVKRSALRYDDEPRHRMPYEEGPPPAGVTHEFLDSAEDLILQSRALASDAEIRETLVRLKVSAAPSNLSPTEMGIWADEFVATLQMAEITRGELGRAYHAWIMDPAERFLPKAGLLIEKARSTGKYTRYRSLEDQWLVKIDYARNWLNHGTWRSIDEMKWLKETRLYEWRDVSQTLPEAIRQLVEEARGE